MRQTTRQYYLNRNLRSRNQKLKYRFSMIKASAARRGVKFDLSLADFQQMWKEQHGLDAYTNERMTLTTAGRGYLWRNWSLSIDRLEPSEGYTKENCVLVRYDNNRRKSKRGFFTPEFIEKFPTWVANLLSLRPSLQKFE